MPTIEKANDTLTHLTSGTLIMLEHGVTQEDLQCSKELWNKSPLNPYVESPTPPHTFCDLLNLHPETDDSSGLTCHEHYSSWLFESNFLEYGPVYFRKFKQTLMPFEIVEQIPVVKMRYAPAHSMDVNESTHAGNIGEISNLLDQGGVGDPHKEAEKKTRYTVHQKISILKYVVLFFGDLATFEHVQSVLQHHSIEGTPWRRFQFVVFVMGLFHLKMACADAIWQIFIEPKHAWRDSTSLMVLGNHPIT